jgi:hypothetical protein
MSSTTIQTNGTSSRLRSTNDSKEAVLSFYLDQLQAGYMATVKAKIGHDVESDKIEELRALFESSIKTKIEAGLADARGEEVDTIDDSEDAGGWVTNEGDDTDDPQHNAQFRQIAAAISTSTVLTSFEPQFEIPGQADQISSITFRSDPTVSASADVRSSPMTKWAITIHNGDPESDYCEEDYALQLQM